MMNRPTRSCDLNLVQRSLGDQLSEAEEERLSAHLCECDDCRTHLEEMAGHPTAWLQIGTTLKAARSSGALAVSGVASDSQVDEDYDAAIDFSVECSRSSGDRRHSASQRDADFIREFSRSTAIHRHAVCCM